MENKIEKEKKTRTETTNSTIYKHTIRLEKSRIHALYPFKSSNKTKKVIECVN